MGPCRACGRLSTFPQDKVAPAVQEMAFKFLIQVSSEIHRTATKANQLNNAADIILNVAEALEGELQLVSPYVKDAVSHWRVLAVNWKCRDQDGYEPSQQLPTMLAFFATPDIPRSVKFSGACKAMIDAAKSSHKEQKSSRTAAKSSK